MHLAREIILDGCCSVEGVGIVLVERDCFRYYVVRQISYTNNDRTIEVADHPLENSHSIIWTGYRLESKAHEDSSSATSSTVNSDTRNSSGSQCTVAHRSFCSRINDLNNI